MKNAMKTATGIIAIGFCFLVLQHTACAQKASTSADALLRSLPLTFVENRGQWEEEVHFQARRDGMTVWLTRNGWTLSLNRKTVKRRKGGKNADEVILDTVAVRMTFEGASERTRLLGKGKRPGRCNFLLGADASKWISGAPTFQSVRYVSLYEGVDVVVREKDGFLEYDVHLEANADLTAVTVRCEGARSLGMAQDGSLVMDTALGTVRQKPPVTWEVGPGGERHPVHCRFVLLQDNRFGFAVEGRQAHRPLIIDPGLIHSTYVGGSGAENAAAVALHQSGDTIVTGGTDSSDFPVTPGAYQTILKGGTGVTDVFVVRLDSSGTRLVYATYLGGTATDIGRGVAVDSGGVATITGQTFSSDFPATKGAFQTRAPGMGDAFVARLSADGSRLLQSTYLGGTGTDQANAVAVDKSGITTVTGYAISRDFPTTPGAFQSTQNGNYNVFVTRLDAAFSSLIFSTFMGGSKYDIGRALFVDSTGVTAVGGQTGSPDFPVTRGAFQTTYVGPLGFGTDAFAAVLNRTGTSLLFSTYLGGSDKESVSAIHMTNQGTVTVAGYTLSWDYPTTAGAFQTTYAGGTTIRGDGFVTRLDPTGARALYSTFLGGPGPDDAMGLSVNSAGIATVSGAAGSGYPVTPGAFQTAFGGPANLGNDGFITRLNPGGNALYYSTYLGGSSTDSAAAVVVDSNEIATTAGLTSSTDFPTTPGAPQRSLSGRLAATITRLDMLPKGITRSGVSTRACAGPVVMGVTRMPVSPDLKFAFTCINAPPITVGYLILGLGRITAGFKVLGVTLYVNPAHPHIVVPVSTDSVGFEETSVPLPAGIRGAQFHCQYLWHNTPQCGGAGTYSASNALAVLIQ